MVKKRHAEIPVTAGSGNVVAELGVAEPEEELTTAQLDPKRIQIMIADQLGLHFRARDTGALAWHAQAAAT
jgi:hypothetical protein